MAVVIALSRRAFVSGAAPLLRGVGRRPLVGCVMNAWFPNSHADVFMSRLLDGYRIGRAWHPPRLETASFYVDQFPPNDMAREEAGERGITVYPTITDALRRRRRRISVDAVAVIGEHGDYPRTPLGNVAYPRRRYFDEITRVMREDGRVLPMYFDKYFASTWADAKAMYDRVCRMRIPLVCGSTVPLTWRRPPLEIPRATRFAEILTTSYADLEEHAYHGIELLQSMAERRPGGETGVARVRYCRGDELWQLAARGEWSRGLLDAALQHRINRVPEVANEAPQAFLIHYRDGLKGTVVHSNMLTRDYLFAARLDGRREPVATCFYIQLLLHNHWSFMVRNFEQLVLTGREPGPIERTLYANGIMLAGLESRRRNGTWIDTPELSLRYF